MRSTCACMLSRFSHARLFVTLWTVAHQTPLFMGFSRPEYWRGLPCPPPGGSSPARDWTRISCVSCTSRWALYHLRCHNYTTTIKVSIQNSSIDSKIVSVLLVIHLSLLKPLTPLICFLSYNCDFPRILNKRSHTVCCLFSLASFI